MIDRARQGHKSRVFTCVARATRHNHAPMNRIFCLAVLLAFLAACAGPQPLRRPDADLILHRGVVHTLTEGSNAATAVVIQNGQIAYVGSDEEALQWAGESTRIIDLQGRTLLPAFHDAHIHPVSGGIGLGECDLNDLASAEAILDKVAQYVRERPDVPWIRGRGWDLPLFPDSAPHKSLLDPILPDRPAYFTAMDGHSAWANSKALELAGITAETQDPPDGRIERDPSTGEPSGTLRESAMDLVERHLPERTHAEHLDGLRRGLELMNRHGIVAIQEAGAEEPIVRAYAELDEKGELTARVVAAIRIEPTEGLAGVARAVEWRRRFEGHRLHATAVKLFLDGVLEARTAAVLEDYTDRPGHRGNPTFEPETLNKLVVALDREGFQIHVHALGDRAARMALDAFEKARDANGPRDSRHMIAHAQLIHPDDIPRFKQLGVIANFQPYWMIEDTYITDLTVPGLGPERSKWLYPMGSLVRSGATVVCGSDWPVTTLNPLPAIQTAITRISPGEENGKTWLPEQCVDRMTAIAGYTSIGARACFEETFSGTIEIGKSADLVVLDRDIVEGPIASIHEAKVLATLLEGTIVYSDPAFLRP